MYSILLPALLGAAAPATAAQAEPWWSALGVSADLDTTIGVGTFVSNRHTDDPYYLSTLSVAPSYAIDDHLSVGLSLSLYYEWTALITPCHAASGPRPDGGPSEDCSDTADPNGRRFDITDLDLSLSHDQIYSLFDIDLFGDTSISLPTSRASQAAKNVLTWSVAAGLSRKLAFITPSLSGRFTKFFGTERAPTLNSESFADRLAADGIPIGRCASFRDDNCVALSGFVPDWRLGAKLGVHVEVPGIEGLSLTVRVGYSYTRNLSDEQDHLSSTKTDTNGEPIVDGVGASDNTSGLIEVAYGFADDSPASGLALAIGVSSQQPARTADGKSIRFPFFDVVSPANNYTGVYFNVAYSM